MEIHGHQSWASMKINGHSIDIHGDNGDRGDQWRFMKINGSMYSHGGPWKFMEVHGGRWRLRGDQWRLHWDPWRLDGGPWTFVAIDEDFTEIHIYIQGDRWRLHGPLLRLMEFMVINGDSMEFHGRSWLSMEIHGYR